MDTYVRVVCYEYSYGVLHFQAPDYAAAIVEESSPHHPSRPSFPPGLCLRRPKFPFGYEPPPRALCHRLVILGDASICFVPLHQPCFSHFPSFPPLTSPNFQHHQPPTLIQTHLPPAHNLSLNYLFYLRARIRSRLSSIFIKSHLAQCGAGTLYPLRH